MDIKEVQGVLKKILVDSLFIEIPEDEITEEDSIGTDLGLDSVGFVELATIIREKYKIEIKEQELTSGAFATIKSLSEFIVARVSEKIAI